MRDILTRLPMLPLTASQEVDFAAADGGLLVAIADDAEMLMGAVHLGVGAIGHLLAHSAVMIEDGSISADCIESLGFMIAEICDMAASCMVLAAHCRYHTADYVPPTG
jgi:hypothetical protein